MVYVPRVDLSLLSCPVTSRPLRIKKKVIKSSLKMNLANIAILLD